MSDQSELVSINDPGETDRAEHTRGDRFVVGVGNAVAWIFPVLMLAIVLQVVLRSAGRSDLLPDQICLPLTAACMALGNQAWLDDLQWWLYGTAVLVGVAYAVTTNSHVRVDIFYDNFTRERQAKIDIFGLVWLFLPFVIICWDQTFHYTVSSWAAGEGSDSPNGLHRLYLLKTAMNLCFVLMAIAIWAAYYRLLYRVTHPALWKQLLFAFPSTFLTVNLSCYYIAYWYYRLTTDLQPRAITREPIFDVLTRTVEDREEEILLFGSEISIMILITMVVTAALIGIAYWTRQRPGEAA
ncbi:MAG: TRAP transporter small permease subunit [Pseudomonadota bacterium]